MLRHARASHFQLDLVQQNDGQIIISIEGDGIGIADTISPILQERASSLPGSLQIERRSQGGILVELNLLPT